MPALRSITKKSTRIRPRDTVSAYRGDHDGRLQSRNGGLNVGSTGPLPRGQMISARQIIQEFGLSIIISVPHLQTTTFGLSRKRGTSRPSRMDGNDSASRLGSSTRGRSGGHDIDYVQEYVGYLVFGRALEVRYSYASPYLALWTIGTGRTALALPACLT